MTTQEDQELFAFVSELVRQRAAGEPVALFLGAGAAMGDPVGLPGAQEVCRDIVEYLERCNPRILLHHTDNALAMLDGESRMRLEYLCSIIVQMSEPEVVWMLLSRALDSDLLNNSHISTAMLCKSGFLRKILTPNFDTLLEESLRLLAPEVSLHIDVFPLAEAERPKPVDSDVHLMKVHGCVTSPESIAATLDRIGSGFTNEEHRRLAEVFETECILVVGWSDNDYDLTPFFQTAQRPLYWVHHQGGPSLPAPIEEMTTRSGGRSITADSEHFWTILSSALGIPRVLVGGEPTLQRGLRAQTANLWVGEIESLYGAYGSVLLLCGLPGEALRFFDLSDTWLGAKVTGFAEGAIRARKALTELLVGDLEGAKRTVDVLVERCSEREEGIPILTTALCAEIIGESIAEPTYRTTVANAICRSKEYLWLASTELGADEFEERLVESLLEEGYFLDACICADSDIRARMSGRERLDTETSPNLAKAKEYLSYGKWRNDVLRSTARQGGR